MTKRTSVKGDGPMSKSKKSIIVKCLAIIAVAIGLNYVWPYLSGKDALPSESTANVPSQSSDRNAAFKAEDAKAAREALEAELNVTDAPDEGMSRKAYENLEQPAEINDRNEVLIFKQQYIVSYNLVRLCPTYACWKLTSERIDGPASRFDRFLPDNAIADRKRVTPEDYSRSGYDRGHMCPAADNKNNDDVMRESFFMTNICPQSHSLNAGGWKELEEFCRSWVKDYGDLYICCGPIFDKKQSKTIGRKGAKVSVPDSFFKVILYIGRQTQAIGFVYPNDKCDGDMRDYAVTVDDVEKITGLDFFYQLDDKTEKAVESKCNPAAWGL